MWYVVRAKLLKSQKGKHQRSCIKKQKKRVYFLVFFTQEEDDGGGGTNTNDGGGGGGDFRRIGVAIGNKGIHMHSEARDVRA